MKTYTLTEEFLAYLLFGMGGRQTTHSISKPEFGWQRPDTEQYQYIKVLPNKQVANDRLSLKNMTEEEFEKHNSLSVLQDWYYGEYKSGILTYRETKTLMVTQMDLLALVRSKNGESIPAEAGGVYLRLMSAWDWAGEQ